MVLMMEPAAPVRDAPARQVLAEAIAAHRAAQADHAGTVAAADAADQRVYAVRRQVDTAEEALREAPQAAADHQLAVARGAAGPAPATTKECREALADLEDELLAARSSRDLLRQRIPADAERVTWAERRCRDAALNVLRVECAGTAAELLTELERGQQDVARLGRVLEWLMQVGVIEGAGAARAAAARHQIAPCGWFRHPGASDPAAGWVAAVAALQANADAPAAVVARA